MQEMWVQSLDREDPLEKEMAIHSSIPAWEIPWTEEPGGLQSMRSQKRQIRLSNSNNDLWDLSSPAMDWTPVPRTGRRIHNPRPPGKSQPRTFMCMVMPYPQTGSLPLGGVVMGTCTSCLAMIRLMCPQWGWPFQFPGSQVHRAVKAADMTTGSSA